jgi:gas vesicle protein
MLSTILGIGIGAMATFFADPQGGRRRRTQARDQLMNASRKTRDAIDAAARDLSHRRSEVLDTVRGTLEHDAVKDYRLVKRVRAAIGPRRSRRNPLNWAAKTQALAAVGLAATGVCIARYARR